MNCNSYAYCFCGMDLRIDVHAGCIYIFICKVECLLWMASQAVCLVNAAGQATSWYYVSLIANENCQSCINKQRLFDLIIVVAGLSNDYIRSYRKFNILMLEIKCSSNLDSAWDSNQG